MEARRFDRDPMSVAEFLDWHQYQEERYELVQGIPVRMMTGARQDHNVAISNVVAALVPKLRGGGCKTTSSDTAVVTGDGQVRYLDVVVDCGPPDPEALTATDPRLVIEVASPSTRDFDLVQKLDEYRATLGIAYVLLVEPAMIDVTCYARTEEGWATSKFLYLDAVIDLPALGTALSLAEIYEGLLPEPRPPLLARD